MDLKKIGISELKTEYAYIKKLSKDIHKPGNNFDIMSIEILADIMNYSAWLNETPITTEIFGKNGIIKGVLLTETNKDGYSSVSFSIEGRMQISLVKITATDKEMITLTIPPTNNNEALFGEIQTLADLARLTAANPIPFRWGQI